MQRVTDKKKLMTVIACAVVQICVGILYLWSIFKTPIVEYYSWSNGAATMVSPLMLTGFVLGNLIGGYLQDKTNPRIIATAGAAMFSLGVFFTSLLTSKTIALIFLTYCAVGGLGCGFAYASILSCLQKWFPHKRGFASGIAVASFAASTVIFGPLSQLLLQFEGFGDKNVPYTFLFLSIVFFVLSMVACLFIRLPKAEAKSNAGFCFSNDSKDNSFDTRSKSADLQEQICDDLGGTNPAACCWAGGVAACPELTPEIDTKGKPGTQKNYTPLQAMKTLPFWCIALTLFFINGTWNMVVPMIKDLGMQRGLSQAAAVAAETVTGITNTLGRFGMATVSDKIGRSFTLILLAAVTTLAALVLIIAEGYMFLVIIALLAFCYGGPSSTLPAMTTDLFGTKYGGTNYGIAMLGLGVSSIVFNLLSIWIDNQTASFVMGAATAFIAAVLMFVCHRISKAPR